MNKTWHRPFISELVSAYYLLKRNIDRKQKLVFETVKRPTAVRLPSFYPVYYTRKS